MNTKQNKPETLLKSGFTNKKMIYNKTVSKKIGNYQKYCNLIYYCLQNIISTSSTIS